MGDRLGGEVKLAVVLGDVDHTCGWVGGETDTKQATDVGSVKYRAVLSPEVAAAAR